MTILLVVIPWSEQYSMLDSFPHGRDVETDLLAFFVILGLILLFARARKKGLNALLAPERLFLSVVQYALLMFPDLLHGEVLWIPHSPPPPGLSLGIYNLPLQI